MPHIHFRMIAPQQGKAAFLAGHSLSFNPWVHGTVFARLWADGWLREWLGQPGHYYGPTPLPSRF